MGYKTTLDIERVKRENEYDKQFDGKWEYRMEFVWDTKTNKYRFDYIGRKLND